MSTALPIWATDTTTLSLAGRIADGAGVIGVVIDNRAALINATSKIVSFQNAEVEKAYINYLGSFNAGPGTTLLPAYSFVADPDTGIWNSAGDTIGFATNGITRATIDTVGLNLITANAGAGINLDITATAYTTLLGGGLDVARLGAITGVNGETMIDVSVTPNFTLTEPGAGLFTYRGVSIDMFNVAVTAGAGSSGIVGLFVNANTDADAGTRLAMYAIGNDILQGNVGIGNMPFAWGANSALVLGIANGTPPAAAVANEIQLYSVDSSDAAATLGLMLEQAVAAIGVTVATTKIKVLINGVEYYLLLSTV